MDAKPDVRLDKWLWAARVFKTRALALAACRAGHVKVGDATAKPGRPAHVGETVVVRIIGGPTRTLRVVGVSERRVGPKLTATLFEDLTPPEEKAREPASLAAQIIARPKGAGRPTKRERRRMERWLP